MSAAALPRRSILPKNQCSSGTKCALYPSEFQHLLTSRAFGFGGAEGHNQNPGPAVRKKRREPPETQDRYWRRTRAGVLERSSPVRGEQKLVRRCEQKPREKPFTLC